MYAFDALYNGEISTVKKIVMSHMSVKVLFETASIRGVLIACRCTG